MPDIALDVAHLVALLLESIVWSFFTVVYLFCSRALLFNVTGRPKKQPEIQWLMVAVLNSMFFLSTLHISVTFYQCIYAFSVHKEEGGALKAFGDVSHWTSITLIVIGSLQGLVVDAILIYRCWLVYNHRWLVVASSIFLWFFALATSIAAVTFARLLRYPSTALKASKNFWPVMISTLGCSIAVNILTTGLIVYRIWRVDKKNRRVLAMSHLTDPSDDQNKIALTGLRRAMYTIIESGVLYTGWSIITFITFITRTNSSFIAFYVQVPLAGIAFTLIIVRAWWAKNYTSYIETNTGTTASRRGVQLSVLNAPASQQSQVQVSFRRRQEGEVEDARIGSKHVGQEDRTYHVKIHDSNRDSLA